MNNLEKDGNTNNKKNYCENCGEKLELQAEFCTRCGKSVYTNLTQNNTQTQPSTNNQSFVVKNNNNQNQKKYNPNDSEKSRTIAALLAFFF